MELRSAPFNMNPRPISVTIISGVMIAAGVIGLVYHLSELKVQHPFQYDIVWISLLRLLAIVAGVFMLRRADWARWLTMAWITLHVAVSAFHSMPQLAMHGLILVAFAYFLFRRQASEYFRGARV
jgi:hypothetical protein